MRLAPDPALPQRDELLAGTSLARWLGPQLGLGPAPNVKRVRAKYRIGESLRLVLRLESAGLSQLVSLRAFPPGASAAVHAATGSAALHHARLGVVAWPFPHDRKLRGLPAITAAPHLLAPGCDAIEVAAYAPEKCLTLRCLRAGRALAYAKVYAGEGVAEAMTQNHRALAERLERAGVPVAEALEPDGERGIARFAAVAGPVLTDLPLASAAAAYRALAGGLARLHRLAPPTGAPAYSRASPGHLATTARLVAAARPELEESLERLRAALEEQRPEQLALTCLHGDVHPRNAIANRRGITLIDLDQAAIGPPEADLAGLFARLRCEAISGLRPTGEARALRAALICGYREARGHLIAERLRWFEAASMLGEWSMRTVNRVHDDRLDHLDAVVDLALDTLMGAPVHA